MKKLLLTAVLGVILAGPAKAQTLTGNEMLTACRIMHQLHAGVPSREHFIDGLMDCYGYLRGYLAAMRFVADTEAWTESIPININDLRAQWACYDTNMKDASVVIADWLNAHPERIYEPAPQLIFEALAEASPCWVEPTP